MNPGRSEERQQLRDECSRRAVAAAVAVAREHDLRVDEPVVLADLFSLMVHLRPAPVVARVPTWITRLRAPSGDWLRREIEVTTYLAEQGAPVVAPSPELPPGPHRRDGFEISFWTYIEPDLERTPTATDCAAMLTDLHAVLRSYPGALPPLVPANIDIPGWLEMVHHADDALSDDDIAILHAAAERVGTFDDLPADAVQPLHGDAHSGNIIGTRDGFVWIDFEDVCLGPVEWDLASIMDADAVAAHFQPDPELLAQCVDLRTLQVALCLIGLYDVFGDRDSWDGAIRHLLDTLASTA